MYTSLGFDYRSVNAKCVNPCPSFCFNSLLGQTCCALLSNGFTAFPLHFSSWNIHFRFYKAPITAFVKFNADYLVGLLIHFFFFFTAENYMYYVIVSIFFHLFDYLPTYLPVIIIICNCSIFFFFISSLRKVRLMYVYLPSRVALWSSSRNRRAGIVDYDVTNNGLSKTIIIIPVTGDVTAAETRLTHTLNAQNDPTSLIQI